MAAMDTTVATTPEDVGLSSAQLGRVKDWSQRLVDGGKLAGVTTMVARRGRVAHLHSCGLANRETGQAMAPDTIVRIYSMTKPLTSVAIMMLYEQGRFQLDDPVSSNSKSLRSGKIIALGFRFREVVLSR
jgi:CubicO group peptidase (beta-lactamase class C family)